MAELNRTCIVCGTRYTFCGHCANEKHKDETWRNIYCSDNCKNIFNVLSMYSNKHIGEGEAKDMLSHCDLSKSERFMNDIKKQINDLVNNRDQVVVSKVESKFQKPFASQQNKPKDIVKDNSKK